MKTHRVILLLCLFVFNPSWAQADEALAKKLYERLVGVKAAGGDPVVQQMAVLISENKTEEAADLAIAQSNFLNITVKHMALKMSTREETIRIPLNDFAASFIGVARDETDARELLYGNFFYRGDSELVTTRAALSADILRSNNHYVELDSGKYDISKVLVRVEGQKMAVDGNDNVLDNPDPAGVLTSRAFMEAHAVAGTNRRLVEFAFRQFMCVPIENWADTGASDARIGRDIDRFPGGDHSKYLTSCMGCHTTMDGFRGAFAKYDYSNNIVKHVNIHTGRGNNFGINIDPDSRGVVLKMNQNASVYSGGFKSVDDSFVNNANRAANATLFGWRGNAQKGKGVKEFGQMVANSSRFSQCMAKRAFEQVCRKDAAGANITDAVKNLGSQFEASNYNLKKLFKSVALHSACLGE